MVRKKQLYELVRFDLVKGAWRVAERHDGLTAEQVGALKLVWHERFGCKVKHRHRFGECDGGLVTSLARSGLDGSECDTATAATVAGRTIEA